ncbi:MAG: hypothetical protein AAF196_15040 [Planctomycetota bacterium]
MRLPIVTLKQRMHRCSLLLDVRQVPASVPASGWLTVDGRVYRDGEFVETVRFRDFDYPGAGPQRGFRLGRRVDWPVEDVEAGHYTIELDLPGRTSA